MTIEITLEDDEIKTLTKTIELLKTMETVFDNCYEFDLNRGYYNIEVIDDTIDFLKNLCHGRKIEGCLIEER